MASGHPHAPDVSLFYPGNLFPLINDRTNLVNADPDPIQWSV